MSIHKRIVIIISVLIINGECIQVIQDKNSNLSVNSTTLYPVEKNVFSKSNVENEGNKIKPENLNRATLNWNINTTFALPNDDYEGDEENDKDVGIDGINIGNKGRNNEKEYEPNSFSFPNDDKADEGLKKAKLNPDRAKENTKDSKDIEKDRNSNQNTSIKVKEFKPSPHLISYLDTLEDTPLRSFTSFAHPEKVHSSSFFESPKGEHKHPSIFPQGFVAFPYKYEHNVIAHANAGWSSHGLQSKPTDEAPVRIPAGGLYRNPDVLKEKPNSYRDDEEFSLDVLDSNNLKDGPLKKRSNPWKSLLHLVTALLPVSLIVSALTPSIITVKNTGTDLQNNRRLSRRSDDNPSIPAVSEQCKRRLLCEIHSERNYQSTTTPHRRSKLCYKIHCEDPQAVSRVLNWLLTHHRSGDSRGRGYT